LALASCLDLVVLTLAAVALAALAWLFVRGRVRRPVVA